MIEQHKIKNLKNDFPGKPIFEYRELAENECRMCRLQLNKAFNIDLPNEDVHTERLLKSIYEKSSKYFQKQDVSEDTVDFSYILNGHNVDIPKKIYINWYHFDDISKLSWDDFCKYFGYIWCPGSDDIEIFDDSFSWLLSVHHSGFITFYKR